jgi:hypothetical protein
MSSGEHRGVSHTNAGEETAMTIEQGAEETEAVVKIRTSRYTSLTTAFVIAGLFFVEVFVGPR